MFFGDEKKTIALTIETAFKIYNHRLYILLLLFAQLTCQYFRQLPKELFGNTGVLG